jgi:hypothetical protein
VNAVPFTVLRVDCEISCAKLIHRELGWAAQEDR